MLYINEIVELLKHSKNPELDVSNEVRLVWAPGVNMFQFNYVTSKIEKNRILAWYQSKKFKTLIMSALVHVNELNISNSPHATFVVLRKTKLGSVQFMYVDSHGYSNQDTNYEIQTRLKSNLLNYLQNMFGPDVACENVLEECPMLQTATQGGNCVQWSIMMMALFVSQPDMFDKLQSTIYKLSLYPLVNIHLFSLSVFLRTLPRVGLLKYLRVTIVSSLWNEQVFRICEKEDSETRAAVTQQFGVPNCYKSKECKAPCFQTKRSCMFRTASDGNTFLSPKEIAGKMLHLYAEIWDMTGHDPDSMSDDQILEQLNFPDFVKSKQDQDNFTTQFELTEADLDRRESFLFSNVY